MKHLLLCRIEQRPPRLELENYPHLVSEWVSIAGAKLGCRDPDDDKLLETALMGEADCLITGDRDLLEMSSFHDIPILTPTAFLDLWTLR